MFDNLTEKLQVAFRNITGKGKITEENIQEALTEIRRALLEADVNFKVVKKFINEVRETALGQEVTKGLDPGQQLIKVVHDKLIEVLGGLSSDLVFRGSGPHVIMMVGLQGSGKTTTCGKLAGHLRQQGKSPFLVPCDVYRPAAIQQLQTVGAQVDVPVFESSVDQKPQDIVKAAVKEARSKSLDTIIVDTAGRLHIDEDLMEELRDLKVILSPSEILFVADAMTGQDAVNSAKAFHESLDVSGIVLTKMDGDARGGAALSVKSVTERPIKFIGTSEKLDGLERFHPDRMASRILGMGDVLSLIEQVQSKVDKEEAEKLQERMLKNQFTLEDFGQSITQINRMGDLGSLMKLIPGMNKMKDKMDAQSDTKQFRQFLAMISSMTHEERKNHAILNQKRKQRIAKGSGTSVNELNAMLSQFMQMKKMMGMMTKPGKLGKLTQMFSKAGLGDFAKSVMPGMRQGAIPADMDVAELQRLAEQHGGKLPPEVMTQLGIRQTKSSGNRSSVQTRAKVDRKKQKAKRKQGKKRK